MQPRRLTLAEERRLQQQMNATTSKRVYRRTLGVLEYGRGESATAIARRLGVHRSHIYRWWDAYCQTNNPSALEEADRCGRPCLWTPECTWWLQQLMKRSPRQWGHLAVDWTVPLLHTSLKN